MVATIQVGTTSWYNVCSWFLATFRGKFSDTLSQNFTRKSEFQLCLKQHQHHQHWVFPATSLQSTPPPSENECLCSFSTSGCKRTRCVYNRLSLITFTDCHLSTPLPFLLQTRVGGGLFFTLFSPSIQLQDGGGQRGCFDHPR